MNNVRFSLTLQQAKKLAANDGVTFKNTLSAFLFGSLCSEPSLQARAIVSWLCLLSMAGDSPSRRPVDKLGNSSARKILITLEYIAVVFGYVPKV